MPRHAKSVRVEFSAEHDKYLGKYLATHCPSKVGRSGNRIFQRLVANEHNQWPWSVHHTWQSWRERYVKNADDFDQFILKYQEKQNAKSADKRKRAVAPTPIEMLGWSAKRAKLEEEEDEDERSPSSETRAVTQRENTSPLLSKPTSKSRPKYPHEPQEIPSQPPDVNLPRESEPANTPHATPVASPHRANANASGSATKKRTLDPITPQTPHDTLEIPSSPPDRQAPPRRVKRTKVGLRAPSDTFASEPSSPKLDAATATVAPAVSAESPSSQTQHALSAPSTGADTAPVATLVYSRAPPRVVDSLHGQVLVDREGRVPRVLPHGERDGAEEEVEVEDKAQWPPARVSTAKQRSTSGPNVEICAHHAFSQPQPHPQPEALRGQVSPTQLDRRTVADQFSSQRRDDVVQSGASPVKRVVTTAPPSDPFAGEIPKPLSKVFKFPAPRASTRSPFRLEAPVKEIQRSPSRTKAARHPALTRIRRQTTGHGHNGNGKECERWRRREHERKVPSVDLVAFSRSSTSAQSHSCSSMGTSILARPPRWSLPASTHATPWMFGDLERWGMRSPVHGDLLGRPGTLTPRLMLTPPPARLITGANASAPHTNGISGPPSVLLTPHPPDVPVTAAHGLASILAHMSANHGLALSVVETVYKRVGSLRETDEVLKGMREVAEGFGEREIERRVRGRRGRGDRNGKEAHRNGDGKTDLRYVMASEDGEGSEYSPPQTSRAAMWKRQSESASYDEGGGQEDEEAEEGRAVEEELRDLDEHEDDDGHGTRHDFSQHLDLAENGETRGQARDEHDGDQREERVKEHAWEEQRVTKALLGNARLAQELERKLGKGQFRRDVVKLFV